MDTTGTDIWKEFERNVVSHSAAHHIVAIAEALKQHGYSRVSDVAKALNITRGSASLTLKLLKQKGFVIEDDNRFLLLSEKGERVAQAVMGKRYLIQRFLRDFLGVSEETAIVDSCKIEHLIGVQTAEQLAQFMRFVESPDPRACSFLEAWRSYDSSCDQDPEQCPACYQECLKEMLPEAERQLDSEAS
jgi:Mn-dependent DtxR family transcriptional regulator